MAPWRLYWTNRWWLDELPFLAVSTTWTMNGPPLADTVLRHSCYEHLEHKMENKSALSQAGLTWYSDWMTIPFPFLLTLTDFFRRNDWIPANQSLAIDVSTRWDVVFSLTEQLLTVYKSVSQFWHFVPFMANQVVLERGQNKCKSSILPKSQWKKFGCKIQWSQANSNK